MTELTEYQKMQSGAVYDSSDPEIQEMQAEGATRKAVLDAVSETDFTARFTAMMGLFGSMAGPSVVDPPFHVGFGRHIHLGAWVHLNTGCRLLDSAEIHIGDQTNIGPGSQLITLGHPKRPEDRLRPPGPDVAPFQIYSIAKPIHIGAQVWIGASVLVMPGVRIGDGAVIGAGAVVTRDIPARMVAVGNPARVVGSVDD